MSSPSVSLSSSSLLSHSPLRPLVPPSVRPWCPGFLGVGVVPVCFQPFWGLAVLVTNCLNGVLLLACSPTPVSLCLSLPLPIAGLCVYKVSLCVCVGESEQHFQIKRRLDSEGAWGGVRVSSGCVDLWRIHLLDNLGEKRAKPVRIPIFKEEKLV